MTDTDPTPEPTDPAHTPETVTAPPETDNLATVPPQRLAEMVREKRTAEATARRELRDTQASVEGMRRQVIQSLGTLHRVREASLADLDRHIPIESVLTDTGQIDNAKVTVALTLLAQTHPHYFAPLVPPQSSGDTSPTGERAHKEKASWSSVLRGK